jgi:hypothetical protein
LLALLVGGHLGFCKSSQVLKVKVEATRLSVAIIAAKVEREGAVLRELVAVRAEEAPEDFERIDATERISVTL